jgi:hypothetical protein
MALTHTKDLMRSLMLGPTEPSELTKDVSPTRTSTMLTTVLYVDAMLLHDLTTGRLVTGILLFLKTTAIDWYSKEITTVESATTYAAEIVSARTCVEQLNDLRTTMLQYLGVQMRYEKSYLFGDHPSVVYSAMNPTPYLHKRHIALSYHRVISSSSRHWRHCPRYRGPARRDGRKH